jgi:RNA polymerase sigma-70 factor, ECF subfamily
MKRLIHVTAAEVDAMRPEVPADSELIRRTLAGDGEAFDAIVRRHQRRIYRVAWAILRDEAEADSVTQDAFVQAYRHLKRFEGRSGLETWLTRIVVNRARDVLRGRKRWNFVPWARMDGTGTAGEPEPSDGRADPERLVMAAQLSSAIDRAVEDLSGQQRVVFTLRHFEDRPMEEIAEMLGMKPATARVHLFRALKKVRRRLEGWRPARRMEENHHEAPERS